MKTKTHYKNRSATKGKVLMYTCEILFPTDNVKAMLIKRHGIKIISKGRSYTDSILSQCYCHTDIKWQTIVKTRYTECIGCPVVDIRLSYGKQWVLILQLSMSGSDDSHP